MCIKILGRLLWKLLTDLTYRKNDRVIHTFYDLLAFCDVLRTVMEILGFT
jgi:hypothetical protein